MGNASRLTELLAQGAIRYLLHLQVLTSWAMSLVRQATGFGK